MISMVFRFSHNKFADHRANWTIIYFAFKNTTFFISAEICFDEANTAIKTVIRYCLFYMRLRHFFNHNNIPNSTLNIFEYSQYLASLISSNELSWMFIVCARKKERKKIRVFFLHHIIIMIMDQGTTNSCSNNKAATKLHVAIDRREASELPRKSTIHEHTISLFRSLFFHRTFRLLRSLLFRSNCFLSLFSLLQFLFFRLI